MATEEPTPPQFPVGPPAGSDLQADSTRGRALSPKRYVGQLVLHRADDETAGAEVLNVELQATAGHDLEAVAFLRLELEDALGQVLEQRVARN